MKWINNGLWWEYGDIGEIFITIEPRPSYCDRGRWIVKISGIPDIDDADMFPRYYFSLDVAKQEMEEFFKNLGIPIHV